MAHSRLFSPSSWHRNLVCTAAAELNLPSANGSDQEYASEEANEGTQAHEYAELALLASLEDGDRKPRLSVIFSAMEKALHAEMIPHVGTYVDHCESSRVPHSDTLVEQRVDFSAWIGDGSSEGDYKGTADCVVIADGICKVIDFKYGAGIKVSAEENLQLIGYALGVYEDNRAFYEFDKVELHVVQPRLDHIDVWETDIVTILARGDFVKQQSQRILAGETVFVPSEKTCQFCAVKGTCKALFAHNYELAMENFDDIYSAETKDCATLSPEEIGRILPNLTLISTWITKLREAALSAALSGKTVPGYKVVATNSQRRWGDSERTWELFKRSKLSIDSYAPRGLVSPAAAEKLLGKDSKFFDREGLIVKPAGGPSLVTVDDKRPVYGDAGLFEDLD